MIKDDISKEEKESIRLGMLNVFSGGDIKKHAIGNRGGYIISDRGSNPNSRHNVVLRNMEP